MVWIIPVAVIGLLGYNFVYSKKKDELPRIQISKPGSIISRIKPKQVFQVCLPKNATWNNPPVVSNSPTLSVVSQGLAAPLIGTYDGNGGTLTLGWLKSDRAQGHVPNSVAKTVIVFK